MKRGLRQMLLPLAVAALAGPAPASPAAGRAFLCADYGRGRVARVDADGTVAWEVPAPGVLDVWERPGGNVLFSHRRGAKEVAPDKTVAWQYEAPPSSEVVSCQPLPDGAVLVGECGPCRLVEVDRPGAVRKEIRLATTEPKAHYQFRGCRKSPAGTYWVAFYGEGVVREVDGDGKELRRIATPNPYCAIPLPDGNVLVGGGLGKRLFEVDREGKTVWEVGENDLPGNPLRFVAGVQRLAGGTTLVCNWGGFGHEGKQPQLVEVTRDRRVVWQYDDAKALGTVSGVHVADAADLR